MSTYVKLLHSTVPYFASNLDKFTLGKKFYTDAVLDKYQACMCVYFTASNILLMCNVGLLYYQLSQHTGVDKKGSDKWC